MTAEPGPVRPSVALMRVPPIQWSRSTETRRCIEECARIFGVSVEDIMSRRRALGVWQARAACYWTLRKLRPHLSLPQIAKAMGKRDHTSACHGIAEAQRFAAADPVYAEKLREIAAALDG